MTGGRPSPPTFTAVAWSDVPDEHCNPLGIYSETFWAPVLCPTAFLLGRRLVILLDRQAQLGHPKDLVLSAEELSTAIGVGRPAGQPEANFKLDVFDRAMYRLHRYRIIRSTLASDVLEVRLAWPRLPKTALDRLPERFTAAEPHFWAIESPVATNAVPL